MYNKEIKHEIINITATSWSIYSIVKSSNSGRLYIPCIIQNEEQCSCKSFFFKEKTCSHLKKIKKILNIKGMKNMIPKFIPTTIEGINSLMGGLPVGSAIGVYGTPASGKSILTTQMMYEIMRHYKKKGKNSLIIDTEGGSYTIHGWHEILNKRYNLKASLVFVKLVIETKKVGKGESQKIKIEYTPEKFEQPALFVLDIRSVEKLLQLVGRSATISMSRSGKIELDPNDKLWARDLATAPLSKLIKDNNIKGMVVDSVTMPTLEFGTERMNFPVRAEAINWLMSAINQITEENRLITFIVSHETADPIDQYATPEIVGGKALRHSLKFTIYMSGKATSRTPHTDNAVRTKSTREIWMKRHPSKPPMSMYRFLELTPTGYTDFNSGNGDRTASED